MLTSKQRQFLKGLAHALSPVVRVGKAGLTASVVEDTKESLLAHELIKVRVDLAEPDARRAVASQLARETDSELAGAIGKVAILYRRREEKPRITLPK